MNLFKTIGLIPLYEKNEVNQKYLLIGLLLIEQVKNGKLSIFLSFRDTSGNVYTF